MSLRSVRSSLWISVVFFLLINSCIADTLVAKCSTPTDDDKRKINSTQTQQTQSSEIPRRLLSPWRNLKLPARPPRLRSQRKMTTSTPSTTTTTTTQETTISLYDLSQNAGRRMDLIESSASDLHPKSVVWPVRLRAALAAKRFRAPTPTTPAPQVLLKLLQPKPTRPAIYSLDGFVPKPSLKKIASTTEPPFLYGRNDLQLSSSIIRRKRINRFSKEDDDDDYQKMDQSSRRKKPVSRYTAFARKGIPGEDYPVFGFIPQTDFQCREQPGLYADRYTNCQVWHMCPGGNFAPRHSFLCPNGTIFNQKKRICDWWYNVDCRRHSRNTRSTVLDLSNDDEDIFSELTD